VNSEGEKKKPFCKSFQFKKKNQSNKKKPHTEKVRALPNPLPQPWQDFSPGVPQEAACSTTSNDNSQNTGSFWPFLT